MTSKITINCPNCDSKLAVNSERSGKLLRCPKCRAPVQVLTEPEELKEAEVENSFENETSSHGTIVVTPMRSEQTEQGMSVNVRRCDGGSVHTVISTRIIVNEHSSLRREWITITDPLVPAELTNCVGLKTDYLHRTDYESGGYRFLSKFQLMAHESLSAFEVKFLTFDIWGEHVRTLVSTDIRDLKSKENTDLQPEWPIYSENEASEFIASIAFISRVRTRDGQVVVTDKHSVMEEALRFSGKFKENDFEPTKRGQ